MSKCPNCGRENESHYKFCVACGADLKESSAANAYARLASPSVSALGDGALGGGFAHYGAGPVSPFVLAKSVSPRAPDSIDSSTGSLAEFSVEDESEHGDMMGTDAVGSMQVYSNRPQLVEPELVALPDEDVEFETPLPSRSAYGRSSTHSPRSQPAVDDYMPPPKPFSSRSLSERGSAISEALAAEASVSMRMAPLNGGQDDDIEKIRQLSHGKFLSNSQPSASPVPGNQTSAVPSPAASREERRSVAPSNPAHSSESTPNDSFNTLQSVVIKERSCPHCGAILPPNFLFCGRCGTRYEEPVQKLVSSGPQVSLVMIHPDGSEGESVDVGQELEIGRVCGIELFESDPFLSPHHARICFAQNKLTVTDLGSLNGLFLRLRGEVELVHGDMFRIGQQLLRFEEIERMPSCVSAVEDATILGSPVPSGAWGRLSTVAAINVTGQALLLCKPEVHCGRDRGDIRFPEDGFVSGSHCKLTFKGGRCFLQDLGSTNGTYLRIREHGVLSKGDLLLIGQQLFKVRWTE